MKFQIPILLLISILTSCTTTGEIIIDEKGVDMAHYQENLTECESYAQQVKVGEKTAKGTASGAVVGGAVGAVSHHRDTAEGAAIGAITGGVAGLSEGERDQVRVVKNCLRGRGYHVLN
jgi:outer membrane lipoprotein SlyB